MRKPEGTGGYFVGGYARRIWRLVFLYGRRLDFRQQYCGCRFHRRGGQGKDISPDVPRVVRAFARGFAGERAGYGPQGFQ